MDWWWSWLPENASTYAGTIDNLFVVITWITGIIFIIVEVALVIFIFKYRGREGRKAYYIEGNNTAEVVWTLIPAIIVVGLAFGTKGAWSSIKDRNQFPENAYQINLQAEQFEWNATYSGPDGEFGTEDDFVRRNQIHIPVDRPVQINLTSIDVIHSFFVPVFRIKQDAVPGMEIPVWFEATKTGEFELACAELCGLGHYKMGGRVYVHTPEEFERWLVEESAKPPTTAASMSDSEQRS